MKRWITPALGLALLGLGWAAPSAAQDGEGASERLRLRAVDSTTETVSLVVSYSGGADALDGLTVRENGDEVDASVTPIGDQDALTADVLFVVDTSVTTDANALVSSAREALEPLLAELPERTRAAVISAGNASQTLVGLTTNAARLSDALEDLTPGGEGALLSGVVRAGNTVADREGSVPTIILITDGVQESRTTLESAKSALLDGGAPLYVVGLQDGELDEGAFRDIAEESGGALLVANAAAGIDGLINEAWADATEIGVASYETDDTAGVQDLVLSVDGTTLEASYVSGSVMEGAQRLIPRPAVEPGGIEFFRTDAGRYLGFGAAALACVLFAYGVMLIAIREKTALDVALQPYGDAYVSESDVDDDGASTSTAFMQRAAAITEGFAERQGFLTKVEKQLERADLPLRAGEALFFYIAGVVLFLVVILAISQNLLATIVVGGIGALIPPAALSFLANRKKKQFEALLPDTLQLLSSTLRAGYSMMQGVEAVSVEAAEPMGKELRRVVTEARLGRSLEESLEAVAERMDSPDFGWAVMAIRIQREVGGNLSELLMTVAETMTERERLRRDINSLTAEGRISAYVLIALPVGLGFFLWTVNPDYVGRLFDVTMGQIMLAGSILGIVVGYLWMMKIIKIEI